jgi:FkbM family methyltransferase
MLTLLWLLCRHARPLWLREKLFWHTPAKTRWPLASAARLEFAPVTLRHLHPTDIGHRQLVWTGFYERELSRRLVTLANSAGSLLIDVGANVGYFTCLWAALRPQNEVWAFEPSPRVHERLRRNVHDNALDSRVRLFDCALGREEAELEFHCGPRDQTGWGRVLSNPGQTRDPAHRPFASAATQQPLARETNGPAKTTFPVACRRLDDLLPANAVVRVLKIDTEGADTWVLFGAERLLRQQRIEHIFYERNDVCMGWLGIQPGAAEEFLARLCYQVEPLARGGDAQYHAWPRERR